MLKKKLKSNDGATILLALLFFMICTIFGAIILSAATTASGTIAGLTDQEQGYYSINSAAKLTEEEIEGERFIYYKQTLNNNATQVSYGYSDGGTPGKTFGELLMDAGEYVYKENKEYTDTVSFKPENTDTKNKIGVVKCDFIMNTDYSINMTFYIETKENTYREILIIPASYTNDKKITVENDTVRIDSNDVPRKREITNLTWNGSYLNKG